MSRPICVHCGKPYGQRRTITEVVKHREDQPEPSYDGNKVVLSSYSQRVGLGKGRIRSQDRDVVLDFDPGDVVVYREVWDGQSYVGGCKPFCTNRCAIDYARKTYENLKRR